MRSARSSSSRQAAISLSDSSHVKKSHDDSGTLTRGRSGMAAMSPHSFAEARIRLSVARTFLIVFSARAFLSGSLVRRRANSRATTSPLILSRRSRPSTGSKWIRTWISFSRIELGRLPTDFG